METDEALMLEFREGSRTAVSGNAQDGPSALCAFEELFARYRGPLYGFFRRRLDDAARAEELTQETFLAVIRGSARYEPRALVRTYLYGIALKLLSAERRKLHRDPPSGTAVVTESADDLLWVREALEKLPAADREILMLREYEQLSYAEIGELLRLPVNTVRSRLFRSRTALKSFLKPEVYHA
jgi:RNA polymerase sigma-70 factor (ECF subfamily)